MIHAGFSVTTGELPGGDRPSEDRIVQAPGAVIVLDGVSTVSDDEPRGGWYAELLGNHVASVLAADPHADLRYVLEQAISVTVREHGLVAGSSPAATVSIVRHRGETVDALVLADSPVVARTISGAVDQVRDDRLACLVADRPEYAEYQTWLRAGRGFQAPEHRILLQKLRAHQLRYLNNDAPGGYWVAEAVPEAARHAVVRSWPTSQIADILVMTDGASAGVEDYGLYATWDDLAHACLTEGPDKVVRAIHDAEAEDPDGRRWPRYKGSDDKALAYLRFAPVARSAA
ncbi:protein phosphatase 2C domain-containing protein [Streptomyces ipomoeae]|uniref:protein phosphatase 2C domain-containing protein n=1 Tax=Streptomyces ipomoeae TaxID=103232 RepID=UPI0029B725DC|nr:protein phosphatase 2C domain-containing protein [Streptomyces ipomoeae]MDX2828628.1 protein phosphatase 2C domain-containing protein [Streptomyces ipomoeae]